MSISRPIVSASIAVAFVVAQGRPCSAFDKAGKIQGRDNPVLEKILSSDVEIAGEWHGSRLPGYERNVLTITEDPDEKGSYSLEFYFWMDNGNAKRERRSAKLKDGIITLPKPIKGVGLARDSYNVLYTVRVDGKAFLLPSPHAEDLKSADELRPRIAYEFRKQREKPRPRRRT